MCLGHNDTDAPDAEPNKQKQTTRTKSDKRSVLRAVLNARKNNENDTRAKGKRASRNQNGIKRVPKGYHK